MIAVCDPIMEERMPRQAMRKRWNAAGLLALSRRCLERIEDGTSVRTYRLVDCLMSALAMFGLKSPSLLQLDREVRLDGRVRGNLRRLYQVDRVPCDTRMRTRLDRVPARALRPVFRRRFRELQRGKVLKPYAVYGHHYLLSLDGTVFLHREPCAASTAASGVTATARSPITIRCWLVRSCIRTIGL